MKWVKKSVLLVCCAASFSVWAQPQVQQHYSVGDLEVRADSIEVLEPSLLHAKGNVTITQGDSEVKTQEAHVKVPAQAELFDASLLKGRTEMDGEIKLYKEGFLPMSSSRQETYWWNPDKKVCLNTKVAEGYYSELTQVDNNECEP